MLEMGVLPEVAAATSATMIWFTSCSASVVFISFGAVQVGPLRCFYGPIAFCGAAMRMAAAAGSCNCIAWCTLPAAVPHPLPPPALHLPCHSGTTPRRALPSACCPPLLASC